MKEIFHLEVSENKDVSFFLIQVLFSHKNQGFDSWFLPMKPWMSREPKWKFPPREKLPGVACIFLALQFWVGFFVLVLVCLVGWFGLVLRHQQHSEDLRPGIQPTTQQWPKQLQWQCLILNPPRHKRTPKKRFLKQSVILSGELLALMDKLFAQIN